MPPPTLRTLLPGTLRQSLRQPSHHHHHHHPFSTSPLRPASSSSSSHDSHYDPPSGWLFNVPPGQKYQKEGWETVWIYGFWGSLLVLGVGGWCWREDSSIQTWALEEARRRLEAEGILPDADLARTAGGK